MNTSIGDIKIKDIIIFYIIIKAIQYIISTHGSYVIDESMILSIGNITIITWLIIKLKRNKINIKSYFKDYKEKLDSSKKEIIKVVLANIVFSIGISYFILLIIYFIKTDTFNYLINENITSGNGSFLWKIYYFISVVIVASFVEEIVFRDIFLNRLNRKFGIKKAVIYSSMLFGIIHMGLGTIGAVVFGIIACILYLKYENILIPMTVHSLNNFIVSLPFLFSGNSSSRGTMTYSEILTLGSIGFVMLTLSSIWIYKYIKANKNYVIDNDFSYKDIK